MTTIIEDGEEFGEGYISESAFYGCSNLTTITLGRGIGSIARDAFAKCANLTDVYCYAERVTYANKETFNESYIEYDTDFRILLVEQQLVGIDVAFPITLIVTRQHVIVQIGGQRLIFSQKLDNIEQFLNVKSSSHGQLHIAVVLFVRPNFIKPLHSARIAFSNSSKVA